MANTSHKNLIFGTNSGPLPDRGIALIQVRSHVHMADKSISNLLKNQAWEKIGVAKDMNYFGEEDKVIMLYVLLLSL